MVLNVKPAVLQTAQSILRKSCVLTRFAINLYPHSRLDAETQFFVLSRTPTNCFPQGLNSIDINVPHERSTSNKSFDTYSLKVNGRGRQQLTANGHIVRLNGIRED